MHMHLLLCVCFILIKGSVGVLFCALPCLHVPNADVNRVRPAVAVLCTFWLFTPSSRAWQVCSWCSPLLSVLLGDG